MCSQKRRASGLLWFLLPLIVIIGVMLGLYAAGYDSPLLQMSIRFSPFNRLRLHMTKAQVIAMVGQPTKRWLNDSYITWTYETPATGKFEFIFFDTNRRVTYAGSAASARQPVAVGMTERQVVQKMGKPSRVQQSRVHETWDYRHWNDTRDVVWFDDKGRVAQVSVSYYNIGVPFDDTDTRRGVSRDLK